MYVHMHVVTTMFVLMLLWCCQEVCQRLAETHCKHNGKE